MVALRKTRDFVHIEQNPLYSTRFWCLSLDKRFGSENSSQFDFKLIAQRYGTGSTAVPGSTSIPHALPCQLE